jgi:hypothetical protein
MPLVLSIGMHQMSLGLELFARWRSVCTYTIMVKHEEARHLNCHALEIRRSLS